MHARLRPLSLALVLTACSLGTVSGVGFASGTLQVAGLDVGTNSNTHVYVLGANAAGGDRYDGTDVRIARMTPSGTLDVVMHRPAGTEELRGISTDPDSTLVYTLHEDGEVTEWSTDLLSSTTTSAASFWPGLSGTLTRYSAAGWRACDLEVLPGGGFAMSGVLWQGSSGTPATYTDVYTFVHVRVPPTPVRRAPDHNAIEDALSMTVSSTSPEKHCPRLSWDVTTSELVTLHPRPSSSYTPRVERWSLDTSGTNTLSFVHEGGFNLGVDAKWPIWADITADSGGMALARDGLDGRYADAIYIYANDGTFHDAAYNDQSIAVVAPKDGTWSSSYGNHVWWSGDHGSGSADIGVIAVDP